MLQQGSANRDSCDFQINVVDAGPTAAAASEEPAPHDTSWSAPVKGPEQLVEVDEAEETSDEGPFVDALVSDLSASISAESLPQVEIHHDRQPPEMPVPGPVLEPWDEYRFVLWRVLMQAPRSGGQVELHLDYVTGAVIVVKRVPWHRIRESPEAFRQAFPEEPENPWQDLAIAQHLGRPEPLGISGVCLCHGVFRSTTGDLMLASEYLPGGDLFDVASRLGDPGPAREQKAWVLIQSLVDAVLAMHERGFAHGDISLENTLLQRDGRSVALIDFGMAVSGDLSAASGLRGKPSYQAPEMHTKLTYDARCADLFACGVAAYALSLGSYPWTSTRPGRCVAFNYTRAHGVEAFLNRRRVAVNGERVSVAGLMSRRYRRLLHVLLDLEPASRLAIASQPLYGELFQA